MSQGRSLPIEVAVLTDVGRMRSNNEDSYLAYLPPIQEGDKLGLRAVMIVADGMGGHALGELASQTAVKAFTERFFEALARQPGKMEHALHNALDDANSAVYQLAQERAKGRPGTTLTALVLSDDSFYIAHVGDSRAYLFRDGQLRQLTTDHTWVAQEVAEGRLRPGEAQNSSFRNYLTLALGSKPTVEAEILAGGLKEGDLFLLCSDGLTVHLGDQELAALLSRSPNLQETSSLMVTLANDRGGHDNVTVILSQIGRKQPPKPSRLVSEAETPTQPSIPLRVIRRKKGIRWAQVLSLSVLAVAVGVTLGWFVGWLSSLWQKAKVPPQPPPVILRPQRSVPNRATSPEPSISLQVRLYSDGLSLTGLNCDIQPVEQNRDLQRIRGGVLIRFRHPERSYSSLRSGQAKIVLRGRGADKEIAFQNVSSVNVQITEGRWEVHYLDEADTALLLCSVDIQPRG
ncbi:MAG: protein phosphatase 2C domain-containing protein [Candidatus Caldarchaeum sp.]